MKKVLPRIGADRRGFLTSGPDSPRLIFSDLAFGGLKEVGGVAQKGHAEKWHRRKQILRVAQNDKRKRLDDRESAWMIVDLRQTGISWFPAGGQTKSRRQGQAKADSSPASRDRNDKREGDTEREGKYLKTAQVWSVGLRYPSKTASHKTTSHNRKS